MKNDICLRRSYKTIILYLSWYFFVTWCAINIFLAGMDTNTQGARCSYDNWQIGDVYQWFFDGYPCVFTKDFLVGYYFFFVLYLFFDFVRRWIIRDDPPVLWRIIELGVWFLFYWLTLLYLTIKLYSQLNFSLFLSSFLGDLLFFVPLVLCAMIVSKLSMKKVFWVLLSLIVIYIVFILF